MKYPIRFGKYLLLERVNVGGMAEVFKAKAFGVEGFQRILAIKRILPNMSEDIEFINMFVDEARLAVQLNHANIVQIYELGKQGIQYYIAMEYVAGKDLRRIVEFFRKRKQVMPVPLAAYICAKICEGLDYAHRKADPMGQPINLIHRDVSPQNILVSFEGDVKVIDFGIAKAADRVSKTQAGVLKGKFGYMSPEQVSGMEIDRRSDVFAVGVLLWEMLTCQRLFVAETDFSTLEKVRACEIPPMREVNAEVPDELEAVVHKALAKDRELRYQWCSDLNEDLQRFLITDQSIFNSKRMAGFMKETFREDIDAEMSRMQDFMRIQSEDAVDSGSVSVADDQVAPGGESTQIFEVGDDSPLASAATRVGPAETSSIGGEDATGAQSVGPSGTKRLDSGAQSGPATSVDETRSGPVSQPSVRTIRATGDGDGAIAPSPDHWDEAEHPDHTKFVLGGAIALAILILGGAIWWTQFRKEGLTWVVIENDPAMISAELYLDQKLVVKGMTPFDKQHLPAGRHEIKLVAKDYEDLQQVVELQAGKANIVSLHLTKQRPPEPASTPVAPPGAAAPTGAWSIDSDPRGAAIFLGGDRIGNTPYKLSNLALGKMLHIELRLPGYRAATQDLEIRGDETTELKLTKDVPAGATSHPVAAHPPKVAKSGGDVAKALGKLIVATPDSPATKVIIDGRDTKRTTPIAPGDPLSIAPGKHQVVLVFKDGVKKPYPVEIMPGQVTKLIEREHD